MLQPEDDSWAVVVYDSADDDATCLGTAVVIDNSRLLTCLHVIGDNWGRDQVWIAFPKAVGFMHRSRWPAVVGSVDPDLDIAVLRLDGSLPQGVTAPPLRNPPPHALRGKQWWTFGFAGSRRGNSAYGSVAEGLGDGYIRIDADQTATYRLQAGFSGGGVWSPDFEAVVGVVVTADHHGNGEAVTLHQIDLCFPEEKLGELTAWTASEAGETALAAWGWTLARDPEGTRHWRPRGRGVSADSERGFRFRGRSAALTVITSWLDRERPNRRALVVTGSPGSGKSAVLGRIVTTADFDAAAALPASDQAVRATPGSVACAVHAKGKTALEVATEIARAASAVLPNQVEDFAPALRAALAEHAGRRFSVIIDALDEATDSEQARMIVSKVILPLAETCADVGAQVITGSRRSMGEVDLLAAFGESMTKLDLDDPELFSGDDLKAYALATLRLEGGEREGNPYDDQDAAQLVAARIAALSDRNFLVAGLIARAHGLHDERAADPASLSFTASVDAAMREYLLRLAPVAGVPAQETLTALAFAEAPGFSLELWQAAVQAVGARRLTTRQLAQFARSPAASFLVETSNETGTAVFRLFHQALNEALLRAREQVETPAEDQRAITAAFTAIGRQRGWEQAPGYLLRSLPGHATAAGLIDDLLTEDAYLLHVDLRRLIPLADHATSEPARRRSRLLRLTPRAINADPATRIAMFSITETLEDLGRSYTTSKDLAPYRAIWATATPHTERFVLEGHTDWISSLCVFTLDGRTLLASGSHDNTVRIWDPATGTEHALLNGHQGWVNTVCAFTLDDRTLLASGGNDGMVRMWDSATGAEYAALSGHVGSVLSVCALTLDGRTLLASGGYDGMVRIWDPATRTQYAALSGHRGEVRTLCAFTLYGRTRLASGGSDGVVRIWYPGSGYGPTHLYGHYGGVNSVCAVILEGRTLLASGGSDRTVRIWDPATSAEHAHLYGHDGEVLSVCALTLNGRTLLASGGSDRTVRTWDPATGDWRVPLYGHDGGVLSVCALTLDGRTLLASGGSGDPTVRIWDPPTRSEHALRGHSGRVRAVCAFTLDGRTLLASGGSGDPAVRIWDPVTGTKHALRGHSGRVRAVCAFTLNGRTLLASGGSEGAVRIWDPATGTEHSTLRGHRGGVNSVCALTQGSRTLLASGGDDGTVRIWDPATGTEHTGLSGHDGGVLSVCALTLDGRTLLASGGSDRAVRIWDPATGTEHSTLRGHRGGVLSVCAFTLGDRTLLASGGSDRAVRIWDPATGTEQAVLENHTGWVNSVCAFTLGGRTVLASGGSDCTVRIWDPLTCAQDAIIRGHSGGVDLVCPFALGGRTVLASGGSDGVVRIWDPATGTEHGVLRGHRGAINSVCALILNGRTLLASGGDDHTVRIWDPATGAEHIAVRGNRGRVNSVCAFTLKGRTLLASGGSTRTIRIWDPATGTEYATLRGRPGIRFMCAFNLDGRTLLASGGDDRTIRIRDPATRAGHAVLEGHIGAINSMCAFTLEGRTLLASGGNDGTVRIWNPTTGTGQAALHGHGGAVNSLCAFTLGGRTLLASGSDDHTVRIWDPATTTTVLILPVHHPVQSASYVSGVLAIGMAAGLLAMRFDLAISQQ